MGGVLAWYVSLCSTSFVYAYLLHNLLVVIVKLGLLIIYVLIKKILAFIVEVISDAGITCLHLI